MGGGQPNQDDHSKLFAIIMPPLLSMWRCYHACNWC